VDNTRLELEWLQRDFSWHAETEIRRSFYLLSFAEVRSLLEKWKREGLVVSDWQNLPWWRALTQEEIEALLPSPTASGSRPEGGHWDERTKDGR